MRSPDNSQKTVVVGMSGGVDSSVAAAILKEEGYNVIGIFMKNWDEKDDSGRCMAEKDYKDVIKVCELLEIPYYSVDFVKEYWDNVFTHFLEEYRQGFTPNPDILCNREIKFKVFFEKAMELGADYLATGHYCQTKDLNGRRELLKGVDSGKDQSSFLYTLKEDVLKKVIFPIGHLPKSEVRKIAHDYNMSTKSKKDSTGICFIGERDFRGFLSKYIKTQKGEFRLLDESVVGHHNGACFYTPGQRKGLGLGGPGAPWFVIKKDIEKNVLYVERGENHPALFVDTVYVNELSWIQKSFIYELPLRCQAKVRYRQGDQDCTIVEINDDIAKVEFTAPQKAVVKRQSVVFYLDDICIGGAMAFSTGKTYLEQNRVPTL